MFRSRHLLAFIPVLLVFGAWFGWMSFQTDRTQWVSTKVENAMNAAMQAELPVLPRVQIHDGGNGQTYYAPKVLSARSDFDLYGSMLMTLNQDTSVPPIKVTSVSMANEYGGPQTTVRAQATIEFPLFAGIVERTIVHASVPIPHYQQPN